MWYRSNTCKTDLQIYLNDNNGDILRLCRAWQVLSLTVKGAKIGLIYVKSEILYPYSGTTTHPWACPLGGLLLQLLLAGKLLRAPCPVAVQLLQGLLALWLLWAPSVGSLWLL